MSRYGVGLGELLATALFAQAVAGCAVEASSPERPVWEEPEAREPWEPEGSLSAQWGSGRELSCEDVRPEELGASRSFITRANARVADCGPGAGDDAGALALRNSGPFGATAWNVVSRDGEDTGNLLAGGDMAFALLPQPRGFHVLAEPPGGASLAAYSSDGELLRRVPLTGGQGRLPLDAAADPGRGTLAAWWAPGEDGTQRLWFQLFDKKGQPREAPAEVMRAPLGEERFVLGGVDTRGRVLLLWAAPGSGTWEGQWWKRNGSAVTGPFTFPVPESSSRGGRLKPLSGGGLALRVGEEWVLRFPSGEAEALPAPDWLAAHPGSDLVLIRNGKAHALVPPPTFVAGSGCEESLLFFTRDGTACGGLTLPFGGNSCFGRRPGIALDGTVIQQVELGIPAHDQCAWRWWPRLLH